jgi:sulfite exporter TauE/SafE
MLLLSLAYLTGIIHAFDADHIAAVTAIVRRSPNSLSAQLAGFKWGVGHSFSITIAGVLAIALKLTIPAGLVSSLEFIVGITLVFLGILLFRDLFSKKTHTHPHKHGNKVHIHSHSHELVNHHHGTTLVGALHGLAGSASVLILIPITFLASFEQALIYILVFCLGTISAMSAYTFFLEKLFSIFRGKSLEYTINGLIGLINIVLGINFMLG